MNSGKHDNAYFKGLWDTELSGNSWHEEMINKRKNGEHYYEEQTITPVFDEDRQITGFVGIKQDISERKRLEAIVLKAKERLEKELTVAKDIQLSMLPLLFPAFPNRHDITIFAKLIAAREVGGDFYDFYFIDENHFGMVVGDVSGKGVPAVLMMAVCKTLIKSKAAQDLSTASIITQVNAEIARDNDSYMFVTVFMAILNTQNGELVYTNAGHNPSYILSPSENKITKLTDLHGPVVGAMEEITYGESSLMLSALDTLFLYTDGITEAQNSEQELFSDARLQNSLNKKLGRSPKEILENIIDEVRMFEAGNEQADDITVMAVRYNEDPDMIKIEKLEGEITNSLPEIARVSEAFEAFSEKQKVPMDIVNKFNIALYELLNNTISYAYEDEEEHSIRIAFELSETLLKLPLQIMASRLIPLS